MWVRFLLLAQNIFTMTIAAYKLILETASTDFESFLYGYSWDVNIKHKADYPVLRAYPVKWGLPRAESFKIDQEFWVYNINADMVTSWDEAIALWKKFAAKLTGNVTLNEVKDVELFPLGKTVEQGQAIKIIANVTIWC